MSSLEPDTVPEPPDTSVLPAVSEGTEPPPQHAANRSVLIRDFLIFELKLVLDGAMDLLLSPIGALLFIADLLVGGPYLGRRFYRLLRFGEKWDLWLNLYRPSRADDVDGQGLFQAGVQGADSLIGKVEALLKDQRLPEAYRARLEEWSTGLETSKDEDRER